MPAKKPVAVGFNPLAGLPVDAQGALIQPRPSIKRPRISADGFEIDTRSVFEKDQQYVGPVGESGLEAGHLKSLALPPRKTYRRGTHWRVIAEHVRIEAMCHYGSGANGGQIWSGWSRVLPVGTVVECIGWRRFRKDGLVAPQFVYSELPAEAKWSTIWPNDGVWRPWPLAGMLEQVLDEEVSHD